MSAPDRHFRQQVRHLHRLGPRPIGELLTAAVAVYPQTRGFVLARLRHYGEMDPALLGWFGADDWLESRTVLRAVAGGGS